MSIALPQCPNGSGSQEQYASGEQSRRTDGRGCAYKLVHRVLLWSMSLAVRELFLAVLPCAAVCSVLRCVLCCGVFCAAVCSVAIRRALFARAL
jgi:hypothetical protein